MLSYSPLRYPGGKAMLAGILARLIGMNDRRGGVYAEAYAGGAGAALSLLYSETVDRVLINDADPCIFAFWKAALEETAAFTERIRKARLTVSEWERQRKVYQHPIKHCRLDVGFATFFLNRCNRSGIIGNGGVIGGKDQIGKWKIDARFNKEDLSARIEKMSLYRDRIVVSNLDGIHFLRASAKSSEPSRLFAYLDPPYFSKGEALYLNHYSAQDHIGLAEYLTQRHRFRWVLTYDNVPEIRRLYSKHRQLSFALGYSARERRVGSEILVVQHGLKVPGAWAPAIPPSFVTTAYSPALSNAR